jgi:hypothetical protein
VEVVEAAVIIQAPMRASIPALIPAVGIPAVGIPALIPALTPADAQGTAVCTAAAITANIVVAAEAPAITVIIAPIDTVVIVADTAAAS